MRSGNRVSPFWTTAILACLAVMGCSSGDQRLADLARQSADRQTELNRLVETNNQQVIDATKRLVEADTQGRKANIELHRQRGRAFCRRRAARRTEARAQASCRSEKSRSYRRRIDSGGRGLDRGHPALDGLCVSASWAVSQVRRRSDGRGPDSRIGRAKAAIGRARANPLTGQCTRDRARFDEPRETFVRLDICRSISRSNVNPRSSAIF
jgi:hypothetical protein